MKTYIIKNSDIMHKGKIFPEGTTINLDDKDAEYLSDFLYILNNPSPAPQEEQVEEFQSNKEQKNKNIKRRK